MHVNPLLVYGTSNVNVVVDLVELNSKPTSGTITVKFTKASQMSLTIGATMVGTHPSQNSAWTMDAFVFL